MYRYTSIYIYRCTYRYTDVHIHTHANAYISHTVITCPVLASNIVCSCPRANCSQRGSGMALYTYACTHIHLHTYAHRYTYTHIRTYIHTHTQPSPGQCSPAISYAPAQEPTAPNACREWPSLIHRSVETQFVKGS